MPANYLWLIFVGFFVVVIAAIAISAVRELQRGKKIAQAATDLGFTFDKTCPPPAEMGCGHLNLFEKGRNRHCKNALTGKLEDVHVALFDYRYTTGHGKQKRTYHQTVTTFQLPTPRFPAFELVRENFFHKIGQAFGYKDIDFDDFPEFSKRYLLRGSDETAIREFFTPDTLTFFEQLNEKWTIHADGQWLIVYQPSKRIKPANLAAFLEETWKLFLVFPTV